MARASRDFQVFVKPIGGACNLRCRYCYYVDEEAAFPDTGGAGGGDLAPEGRDSLDRGTSAAAPPRPGKAEPGVHSSRAAARMSDSLLENYIIQHFAASPDETILFSWHGGEPTLLGVDFFRRVVKLQRRHCPPGRSFANGMQTNATLIDEEWARFLAGAGFAVGVSMDGPRGEHDRFRRTRGGGPSFDRVRRGYEILKKHGVSPEILCVVNADNARRPLDVYRFFREIGASYISFLPLVLPPDAAAAIGGAGVASEAPGAGVARAARPDPASSETSGLTAASAADGPNGKRSRRADREARGNFPADPAAAPESVPPEVWGDFLCAVFDEWMARDIGRIKVQIFEEAARTAFGQEHSLCIFRPECGNIPVLERNGDFYSCDHFVDAEHRLGNIREIPLVELLESPAQRAFGRAKRETLPRCCRECEVLSMCNGGCPKNRFMRTPDGEPGLNYLCAGYRRFFNHCRPWVEEVAAEWRRQEASRAEAAGEFGNRGRRPGGPATPHRPGRNDPCPCGSGLKYKKCCGR